MLVVVSTQSGAYNVPLTFFIYWHWTFKTRILCMRSALKTRARHLSADPSLTRSRVRAQVSREKLTQTRGLLASPSSWPPLTHTPNPPPMWFEQGSPWHAELFQSRTQRQALLQELGDEPPWITGGGWCLQPSPTQPNSLSSTHTAHPPKPSGPYARILASLPTSIWERGHGRLGSISKKRLKRGRWFLL